MGPFDRIIWTKKSNTQHAVIITFNYGIEELDDLFELESKLRNAIELKQVGEYDGHEIAMDSSDGTLYMYGPNAETLFKCIKPFWMRLNLCEGQSLNFDSVLRPTM